MFYEEENYNDALSKFTSIFKLIDSIIELYLWYTSFPAFAFFDSILQKSSEFRFPQNILYNMYFGDVASGDALSLTTNDII